MIYHFTWNSRYLVMNQVNSWKNKFIEKYWEFNLVNINNLWEVDNNFLVENITALSFFQEKKLILVECDLTSKDTKISEKIDFIVKISKNLPEENILLFYTISPDKRSKQYKSINSISQLKEFSSSDQNDTFNIIKSRYQNKITDNALRLLIRYKSNNIEKVSSEIHKLNILYEIIDEKLIQENIFPELEENIFQFIDDILNKNFISARIKMNFILQDTNIYSLYNWLIANLRTNIYILKLKSLKFNQTEIGNMLNLWNKKFLINKNINISPKIFKNMYLDLISLDKKMKSGKLIWTEEKDFKSELESILLKYLSQ